MTGMNISTLASFFQLNENIRSLQGSLLDGQKELSTGRKADLMAALRTQAATDVDLRNAYSEATTFKATAGVVGTRLDAMQTALTSVKDAIDKARTQTLTATSPLARQQLQQLAKTTIDQIGSLLDTQFDGRYLFSGTQTDMPPLQEQNTVNTTTGLSPLQTVMQVITNMGGMSDAASALNVANGTDGISSLFGDSNSNANLRFTPALYNGATSGTLTARLDRGYQIDYGLRADDPAIRDALQGLYMLAAVPSNSVPDDAYAAWQGEALAHLDKGFQGVIGMASTVGYQQSAVADVMARHDSTLTQLNTQIVNLEQADPYETAAKLSQFQSQLEATFTVTARMSQLSLTKFLT
jgi:flagellar hook-associated protein 3 FlgL